MNSPPESFSKVRHAAMPRVRAVFSQALAIFSLFLLSLFVHIQCNGLLFPRDLNDSHAGDSHQLPDTPHTFLHITLRSLLSITIVSVAGPWFASIAGGNIRSPDADSITTCASFETLIRRQLQKMCYMFPAFLAIRTFTSPLRSPSWVKALVILDMTKISWWSERVFWLALIPCASCVLFKRLNVPGQRLFETVKQLLMSSWKHTKFWFHERFMAMPLHRRQTIKTAQSVLRTYWVETSALTMALCSAVYTIIVAFTDPEAFTVIHHADGSHTTPCWKAHVGLLLTIIFSLLTFALLVNFLDECYSTAMERRREIIAYDMKTTDVLPQARSLRAIKRLIKSRKYSVEVSTKIEHMLSDLKNTIVDLDSTDSKHGHTSEDEGWVAVDKDKAITTTSEHIGTLEGLD